MILEYVPRVCMRSLAKLQGTSFNASCDRLIMCLPISLPGTPPSLWLAVDYRSAAVIQIGANGKLCGISRVYRFSSREKDDFPDFVAKAWQEQRSSHYVILPLLYKDLRVALEVEMDSGYIRILPFPFETKKGADIFSVPGETEYSYLQDTDSSRIQMDWADRESCNRWWWKGEAYVLELYRATFTVHRVGEFLGFLHRGTSRLLIFAYDALDALPLFEFALEIQDPIGWTIDDLTQLVVVFNTHSELQVFQLSY